MLTRIEAAQLDEKSKLTDANRIIRSEIYRLLPLHAFLYFAGTTGLAVGASQLDFLPNLPYVAGAVGINALTVGAATLYQTWRLGRAESQDKEAKLEWIRTLNPKEDEPQFIHRVVQFLLNLVRRGAQPDSQGLPPADVVEKTSDETPVTDEAKGLDSEAPLDVIAEDIPANVPTDVPTDETR